LAVAVVLIWAATGPLFGYSDTWQLVINTGTTIVTFLTVFLIQNAQNRDAKALHLTLDARIHALHGARNELIDLEHLTDAELETIQEEFQHLAKRRQQPVNGAHAERTDEQPQRQRDERLRARRLDREPRHEERHGCDDRPAWLAATRGGERRCLQLRAARRQRVHRR